MKYVQINTVPNGSTGAVMFREQEKRLAAGDECWAMWGRGRAAENDHEFNFGTKLGTYLDAAMTRIDDRAGFHSKVATRRLLAKLDEIDPDIVHLHNLHGYYVNIEMLFQWLEERGQLTYWTLHDCWSFTGHCSHFTYMKCEQWKTHCSFESKCPQKGEYPKSCFLNNCWRNFEDKRKIFNSLPADKLTIVTPSHWLAGLVGQSFLSKYSVEVRHNEIDKNMFKQLPSNFRVDFDIKDKFMILGVSGVWTKRKGLSDFLTLANDLGDGYAIVLVGLSRQQQKRALKKLDEYGIQESIRRTWCNKQKPLFNSSKSNKALLREFVRKQSTSGESRGVESGPNNVDAGGNDGQPAINQIIDPIEGISVRCKNDCIVVLLGASKSKEQLAAIYSAADLFFNPTYEDTYPTVNLEAEACGTPVATYNTGGCCETVHLKNSSTVNGYQDALNLIQSSKENYLSNLAKHTCRKSSCL